MSRTEKAWENLTHSLDEGRLAHAYILEGDPRAAGRAFTMRLLHRLFPDAGARLEAGSHPDVLWVEPQSKSRQIVVKQIDAIIERIQEKSFEGGWKAVVISAADRMNPAGANKLLKTLEEPRGKTLLLLLTRSPESLLATIRSRCQIVSLDPLDVDPAPWIEATLEILSTGPANTALAASGQAGQIKGLLDAVRKELTKATESALKEAGVELPKDVIEARVTARTKEAQEDVLQTVQRWHRDLLLASLGVSEDQFHFTEFAEALLGFGAETDPDDAMRRVRAVDDIAGRLHRNMNALAVLENGLR